jgi:UDP-N-acetyl-D-glucosamine dehydrogenase
LQSTSFPGTTEEVALPKLQHTGRQVGKDFYLAFALERVDPGNNDFSVRNVPKVVGGVTPECTRLASSFLSTFVDQVVSVSSPKVAEMSKLLENIFRSVNIALVNELAMLCRRMDIDIWEVIEAASTKPFGYMPFFPGPGVGGHCIPVDPFYLSWKAKEHEFYVNFIQLAAEVNDNMPYYTLSRIVDALGDHGKPLQGSRILALGVTFKEDINDTRNSPALRVMELLCEKGASVAYNDCYVPNLNDNGFSLKSVKLEPSLYAQFDAVVILVNHSYYDLSEIVDNSMLVIDTRNATRALGPRLNVVKL